MALLSDIMAIADTWDIVAPELQAASPRTYQKSRAGTILRQRAEGMTLRQVARLHGITAERVRQIQLKATAAAVAAVPAEFDVNGPIVQLCLSTRSGRVLARLGCNTVGDVCGITEQQLRLERQCGDISVAEIVAKLAHHGLTLKSLVA